MSRIWITMNPDTHDFYLLESRDMAWVVVGLGNPGKEYENTRHNTGRLALQYFSRDNGAPAWKEDKKSRALSTGIRVGREMVALILPETYMNTSGAAVRAFVKSVKAAEHLIVIQDELDMPLGSLKLSFNRGSGGHRGIESVAKAVKTKRFTRVRVGISRSTATGKLRKPVGEKDVEKFILTEFKAHELTELRSVFKKVGAAIEATIKDGPQAAMNTFNQ